MSFNTNYLLLYKESRTYGKYYYDYIFLKNGKNFDKIKYDDGKYETSINYIISPLIIFNLSLYNCNFNIIR